MCTRDGTPEQARNAVHAISSLINPPSQPGADIDSRVRKEKREFEPLLKALVSPSRLAIPDDNANLNKRSRIVSVLSAIAAVAECAPYAFNSPVDGRTELGWGERAVEFALYSVLLGKDITSLNDSDGVKDDDSESDSEVGSPTKSYRLSQGRGNKGTIGSSKSQHKKNVSIYCQMMCAAIEVLVAHIRSTILRLKSDGSHSKLISDAGGLRHPKPVTLKAPPSDHVIEVFNTLVKIIKNSGNPPSSSHSHYCTTAIDQAELRKCAAINLLRLCAPNLQLEQKYLSAQSWHILSNIFLDRDSNVRDSVMEELSFMLGQRYSPSLRFVALVTLCADGDHGAHSAANANAANVGRRSISIKFVATQCIKSLRMTCQATQAQCRSLGREAEKNFENRLKMKIMPEYCVPFALHLLSFRNETVSAAGTLAANNSSYEDLADEEVASYEAASQKMLKKRLKWLFDPLIHSLGEGADNVSISSIYPRETIFSCRNQPHVFLMHV